MRMCSIDGTFSGAWETHGWLDKLHRTLSQGKPPLNVQVQGRKTQAYRQSINDDIWVGAAFCSRLSDTLSALVVKVLNLMRNAGVPRVCTAVASSAELTSLCATYCGACSMMCAKPALSIDSRL